MSRARTQLSLRGEVVSARLATLLGKPADRLPSFTPGMDLTRDMGRFTRYTRNSPL